MKSDKTTPNVPTLRFQEFTNPWTLMPLKKLLCFQNGINADSAKYGKGVKFISVSDILNNQYITYDCIKGMIDIDKKTKERFLVEYGDILFQRSSETFEDIGRANVYLDKEHPATFGGFVIRGKKISEYNPMFFRYLLCTPNARKQTVRMGAGAQHYNIGQDGLGKISLYFPTIQEQQKIAGFLSAIDDRISVQNKIIEDLKILKKELCNDHFKSVLHDASLRYITLKEILTERKEYCSKDGTYTHGTLSKEGVAPKTERYDRDFLVKNEDKQYKVTHLNDICYNPANLKFGVICRNTYGDLIFSPIYVTFEISDNVYPAYIELFLTNPNFIGRIRRYEQGTVYERMAVSPEDFLSYETHIPAYEEQVEFANEMQRIQRKIELETAFLSSLQNQRRFFLNAMFI
jgi:type I restriction enzyme S subunit